MSLQVLAVFACLILGELLACYFLYEKNKKLKTELTETQQALKSQEALYEKYTKSETKAKKNKESISSTNADECLNNAVNILRNNKKSRNNTTTD